MTSLQQVSMTETESSFLQPHHLWISLSQATLRDLYTELLAIKEGTPNEVCESGS